jgi:hypothetical protein
MAPWNWGRKASRSTVAVPTTPPKQMINEFEWDEESPRSPICTKFNHLTPKQTGYIDRPDLVAALEDIFKSHGKLEFGIIVSSGPGVCRGRGRELTLADSFRTMDVLDSKTPQMGRSLIPMPHALASSRMQGLTESSG